MHRRRILILGSGPAGLATAFELTATPELRAQNEVTVLTQGWRLGGKCASGRNAAMGNRSEEHGLHVWFGYYHNAFAMMRRCFAELDRPASCPIRSIETAFVGRSTATLGRRTGDPRDLWTVTWPRTSPGMPGAAAGAVEELSAVIELFERLVGLFDHWRSRSDHIPRVDGLVGRVANLAARVVHGADTSLHLAFTMLKAAEHLGVEVLGRVVELLDRFRKEHEGVLQRGKEVDAELDHLLIALDLGVAFLRGMLDPRDGILLHGDLDRIDAEEFRGWLQRHGASAHAAWSAPVQSLYDAAFSYDRGDLNCPNYAAGVAVRVCLRVMTTYVGNVIYLPVSGFGEVVIAPLYEALQARGVHFDFFRRVTRLELADGASRVAAVHLDVQAKTRGPYAPLVTVGGVPGWPSEPLWAQLVDGERLRREGVDFESRWCATRVGDEVRRVGEDFDAVVLAIPVMACRELGEELAALPRWRRAFRDIHAVPTLGLQVWVDEPTNRLGVPSLGVLVSGPEPVDIWADMTPILATEGWQAPKPASLHYLCGVLSTALPEAPTADTGARERGDELGRVVVERLFEEQAAQLWPGAVKNGRFDWSILHDPQGRVGPARLGAQYVRVNIDPTECCPTALAGCTDARLRAQDAGIANLVLAGDWLRTGINSSCVEAAVMSGMQASRALCGSPVAVPWETFFSPSMLEPVLPRHVAAERPAMVPTLGHGQQCGRAPGVVSGAVLSMFALPMDPAQAQRRVTACFDAPSGGVVQAEVLGANAYVSFLRAARLFSLAEPSGAIADQEVATWVPIAVRVAGGPPRLMFWNAYVVLDNGIGVITGRETWGIPKEVGWISDTTTAGRRTWLAETICFPTLGRESPGVRAPFVSLTNEGVSRPWSDPAGELGRLQGTGGGVLRNLRQDVELALSTLGDLARARFDLLALKQFPDTLRPSLAAFQALSVAPCTITSLRGGGLYAGTTTATFTEAASHAVVSDLGLPGPVVQAKHGFWVELDFRIETGFDLWTAA